jgi:hypothetical protein
MAKKKWTINSAGGGNADSDLIGCHIEETDTGYDLTAKHNTVLSSTTSSTLPFTFANFSYEGWIWNVSVFSLSHTASGGWTNNDPDIKGEEGTWSAGASSEVDDDEDDDGDECEDEDKDDDDEKDGDS